MKIAVIGSGISGLSAAWALSSRHQVVLFEKSERLGGHANTVSITDSSGNSIAVDTGFMVYNPDRYPNLVKLFHHFNIPSVPTDMSFAVSMDNGKFEYSSDVPKGVFADHANALRVSFYEFLLEITRFNAKAIESLRSGISPHQTLWEWLKENGFSEALGEKYLLPIIGSIWSTPKKLARDFPCAELFAFLEGHHLLSIFGHPQWQTVKGGSSIYVAAVAEEIRAFGGEIRLNVPVSKVVRTDADATVYWGDTHETFEYVVFASHADETLAMLASPSRDEQNLLSKFTYEKNTIYVHSDISLMPQRKEAWASWNYLGESGWTGNRTEKVCLTYYMNRLQNLPTTDPILVTLNPFKEPKAMLVHHAIEFAHPLCTCLSMEIRAQLSRLQGQQRSLFCGSYFGYGFHEDGIASAIEAVKHLGVEPAWVERQAGA